MALFESLSGKLQDIMRKIRGKGRVSEADVKEMMREVRMAMLEADVSFKVVKDFVGKVTERATGAEVLEGLTSGQQVIKVVHEELVALLGGETERLTFSPSSPTVYVLAGLQGSGKTTMAAKLANHLRKQGKNPMMAACDVYRPAAIKQLQVLGAQLGVPVHESGTDARPADIAVAAVAKAKSLGHDVLIVDTAGRLHVDDALMGELSEIKAAVRPQETLLVIDSMTGQDAVGVASEFNGKVGIDGLILTKLDSDTRGGAALSVRHATGRPIKFAGVGEKLSDMEPFHPERMAERILGMGDVLTLIEKAQEAFDERKAIDLANSIRSMTFTLDDFLEQMQQVKKMGSMSQILGMLPGMSGKALAQVDAEGSEKGMARFEAMIKSMTRKERLEPGIINAGRRRRIAEGSGHSVQEVNRLLKSFDDMKRQMKAMMDMTRKGKMGKVRMPF